MGATVSVIPPRADPHAVRWPQVIGLGVLQCAIGLSWIVYAIYLPALLVSLGFNARLSVTLLMLEGLLGILLEPTFGFLSDKSYQRTDTRLPLIVGGVFVAAALFIAIPLVAATSTASGGNGRMLILSVVIGWAVAMTTFRTPATALIAGYANAPHLPRAASVLTLLGAGVAALRTTSPEFFFSLGPAICFGAASLFLLSTCTALWFVDQQVPATARPIPVAAGSRFGPLVTVFVAGAGLGLALFAVFTHMLPRFFGMLPSGGLSLEPLLGGSFLVFGLAAVGAGAVAAKMGNERAILVGTVATAALIAIPAFVTPLPLALVGLVLAILICFSFVANGGIPLALSRVPNGRSGLGLGVYFGGLSATSSLAASQFRAPLGIGEASTFALIGLAVVAAAVWAGRPTAHRLRS